MFQKCDCGIFVTIFLKSPGIPIIKYDIFIIDDLSTGNKKRLNENIVFYKCCISNKKKYPLS